MSEDRGFEVIDKRRVNAEAQPEGEAPPAAEPGTATGAQTGAETEAGVGGAAGAEATGGEGPEGPMPEMDAPSVISLCLNMLHEVAWVKMGLLASPMSQKVERDLAQARLAIDCAADLARHLESQVDDITKRELQNMISSLRMTFVQQSQR